MEGSGEGDVSAPLVFTGLARPQEFPENGLRGAIALIRRGDKSLVPHGNSVLETGDRVTVIGAPQSISKLYELYVASRHIGEPP